MEDRPRRPRRLRQPTWSPALASLAMGALLLPLQHLSMVVTIPLGAVVYGALLFALHTFTEEDRALVRALRQGKKLVAS